MILQDNFHIWYNKGQSMYDLVPWILIIWWWVELEDDQIPSTNSAETIDDVHKNKTIHSIFTQIRRLLLKGNLIPQHIDSLKPHTSVNPKKKDKEEKAKPEWWEFKDETNYCSKAVKIISDHHVTTVDSYHGDKDSKGEKSYTQIRVSCVTFVDYY